MPTRHSSLKSNNCNALSPARQGLTRLPDVSAKVMYSLALSGVDLLSYDQSILVNSPEHTLM